MSPRLAQWLAWSGVTVCLLGEGVGLSLEAASGYLGSGPLRVAAEVAFLIAFAALATVGAVVASRRPGNTLGWLLCAVGVMAGVNKVALGVVDYALVAHPGALTGGVAAAWVVAWSGTLLAGLVLMFLPLLFPEGRLPSPRWRPVAFTTVSVLMVVIAAWASTPQLVGDGYAVRNPLGIDTISHVQPYFDVISYALLVLLVALCAISLLVRFRRASGVQRQQLKWIAYAAVLLALDFVAVVFLWALLAVDVAITDFMMAVGYLLIPLAVGVAIFQYRLYEIDRLISRTVSYAVLTGILGGGVHGWGGSARRAAPTAGRAVRAGGGRVDVGGCGAVRPGAAEGADSGGPQVQPDAL